jgi:hypothetical protein
VFCQYACSRKIRHSACIGATKARESLAANGAANADDGRIIENSDFWRTSSGTPECVILAGIHSGDLQNPFFLVLSKVTFRYGERGGFLGSFTIGVRSWLPSAKLFSRKRSSPSCLTSILVGFFDMGTEQKSPKPVPSVPFAPAPYANACRHPSAFHLKAAAAVAHQADPNPRGGLEITTIGRSY